MAKQEYLSQGTDMGIMYFFKSKNGMPTPDDELLKLSFNSNLKFSFRNARRFKYEDTENFDNFKYIAGEIPEKLEIPEHVAKLSDSQVKRLANGNESEKKKVFDEVADEQKAREEIKKMSAVEHLNMLKELTTLKKQVEELTAPKK